MNQQLTVPHGCAPSLSWNKQAMHIWLCSNCLWLLVFLPSHDSFPHEAWHVLVDSQEIVTRNGSNSRTEENTISRGLVAVKHHVNIVFKLNWRLFSLCKSAIWNFKQVFSRCGVGVNCCVRQPYIAPFAACACCYVVALTQAKELNGKCLFLAKLQSMPSDQEERGGLFLESFRGFAAAFGLHPFLR